MCHDNKTHCCHLELVNQFAIAFISEVFPSMTEKRHDKGKFCQSLMTDTYMSLSFQSVLLLFTLLDLILQRMKHSLFILEFHKCNEIYSLISGASSFDTYPTYSGAVLVGFINSEES